MYLLGEQTRTVLKKKSKSDSSNGVKKKKKMCGDWHFPWFHSLLAIFSPLTTTTLSTHVHTRTDSELAEWKGEFICNLSFCFEASALCECAIFTICWMPLLRCCCSYIGVRNLFTLNVQREKVFWLLRMLCHVCCVSETPQASCAEAHQPANQLDIRITMVNGEKSAFRSSIYTFMHELMFAFALNIMKFICVSTCGICNNCLSWKRYVCSSVVVLASLLVLLPFAFRCPESFHQTPVVEHRLFNRPLSLFANRFHAKYDFFLLYSSRFFPFFYSKHK